MQSPSSLEYKIAAPKNVTQIDNNRDELKDIEYADALSAGTMTMILKAEKDSKLNLARVKEKAKTLFQNSETLGIKKLLLEGTNDDGVFEPIDLIEHKVDYHGSVEYNNYITDRNMFDFLRKAYYNNYDYFRKFE